MKNDLQAGLQNIIDAINNLIEPKLGSLRYDKTFRAKVISDEGNNVYGVQINGKNYKAVYTGEKIPVGQIVKVKAPLNNFSDIYIETLPGSGSGSAGNYNDLLNKPILNTNNTGTQVPSATETIQGTISLHKVSKTGNYNDLLNKPTLDFIPTSEKGAANGVASLDENKKVSKSNLPTDTVYDNNYVHTDNNFTTAMKNKLDSVEEGAEPNKIEIIQRNGSVLPINNKIVNVEVPTKTSDLTNDNGFISSIPVASDTILGGIKVGENLSITADGVLSAKGGGTTDYSVLLNKPVLNTANTKSLAIDSNETINGVVSLHKISKTGSYEDLLNKPTIPTKTSDLENDSGFITNTVDNLTNYYLKSETYNQTEVNNLIGQIKTISIEVVNTLPTTGEDNKIYLVPKEGSTGDVYNEYIWVNNTWELIGSTQVDLTGYATQDWVNNQIKDFLNESQVTQIVNNSLTNYYTKTETYSKTEVNNLLNGKANADDIPTKTGDLTNNGDGTTGSKYITNSDLNTELESKQDKITGGATTIVTNDLTVNRALVSNANGKVAVSNTTSTELEYLSGARSNLQAQIDTITTEGGQPNIIEVVQENGAPLEITNKTVNVIAPTNLVNGIAEGSLRAIGSKEESSIYSLGKYAFVEGDDTKASGYASHAEGDLTEASGSRSHAEGYFTKASNFQSHAEGAGTVASGLCSHAEGQNTIASGESQHVQGNFNISDVTSLDIVGNGTSDEDRSNAYTLDANGNAWYSGDVYVGSTSGTNKDSGSKKLITLDKIPTASSETLGLIKVGENLSITEDGTLSAQAGTTIKNLVDGTGEGALKQINTTRASGKNSFAEGHRTTASGDYSHAEGQYSSATNTYSHAEGNNSQATGVGSHAEGSTTMATGMYSHTEGNNTKATGDGSHAEGHNTTVGRKCFIIVSGNSEAKTYTFHNVRGLVVGMTYSIHKGASVALEAGVITAIDTSTNTITVNNYENLSENNNYFYIYDRPDVGFTFLPYDSTSYSHAEGQDTVATHPQSHAEGLGTIANGNNQHVQGKYNISDDTSLDIIGNGTGTNARSNAYTLDRNGNAWYSGNVYVGSTSGTNKDDGSKKLLTSDDITKNIKDGSAEGSLQQINATSATGKNSFAIGYHTQSIGETSVAEGTRTEARGNYSHAEGNNTKIYYKGFTIISGDEGTKTYTLKDVTGLESGMSFMITTERYTSGYNGNTITNVDTSSQSITVNKYFTLYDNNNFLSLKDYPDLGDTYLTKESKAAHAEGVNTLAAGSYSHAEGNNTVSAGEGSHSEGGQTKASGMFSHAEGWQTQARGYSSHSEGRFTISNADYQHVQGTYNIADDTSLDIVGNGEYSSDDSKRSNAYTLDRQGNGWFAGEVYVGSTSGTNKDSGSVKLAKITDIPTKTSNLTNDSGYLEFELVEEW